ncbi:MAG TPA: ferritin-like domain-containing protein [Bryobacteraceae bacterium]|nr:ferritin-like domain-containing protein [Bryobacteraceae bacterium]
MKFNSLHDLYVEELRDLYSAEKQILKALPKVIESTHSADLRTALSTHLEETKHQVNRLEQVFKLHNEPAKAETCDGMKGILEEAADILDHDENAAVRDAGIISGCQRVEHYEIAAYGSVRAWAEQMGHREAAQILQQTLEEEKRADKKLTEIASQLNLESVRRAG